MNETFANQTCAIQMIKKADGTRSEVLNLSPADFASTIKPYAHNMEDYLIIILADNHTGEPGFSAVPVMHVATFINHFAKEAQSNG